MSDFEIKVEGLDEIVAQLRALPDDIRETTGKSAMHESVMLVKNIVQQSAPVGKPHSKRSKAGGYYRSSIKANVDIKSGTLLGQVKVAAPHAHLVEFGFNWQPNSRMKKAGKALRRRGAVHFRVEPKPQGGLVRGALYGNSNRIRQVFVDAVNQSIRKVDGGGDNSD